ncbi:hypothetical protein A1O3_09683 [Capronia epimyces CBS 606.96]|uniref:Uncharacterized protein n=1 Tax=Capronia epimyces CBS 606.96 TaxID=1182542 RepID=W9XAF7_9EURO|nr:uncharacterized protein A1O3_09683 [Capronia epimyces CBS 606.96]EXJ77457.1 hypothetical protein A1O3_09683 [Capronia epimyces CBS 606.96]
MSLSPSTWRVLGRSVSTSYISLGIFAITYPVVAAKCFGIYPITDDTALAAKATGTATATATGNDNGHGHDHGNSLTTDKQRHASAVLTSMRLLGARDLSIGIALAWLDYQEKPQAVGTVILSGLVLCVVDVYEIWRLRGWQWAAVFAAGAGLWMSVGYGLMQ